MDVVQQRDMIVEYQARREALFAQLPLNSIAILLAAPIVLKSADTEYPYRQNSNFYYFTGFNESDAALVLHKTADGMSNILFCHGSEKSKEIWTGKKLPLERAVIELGVDNAYLIKDLVSILKNMFIAQVYALQEQKKSIEEILGLISIVDFIELNPVINAMRMIKSKKEIELLRKAAVISSQAHVTLMQACRPQMYEYELHALLLYFFRKNGANGEAYTSIVASGVNACTLHYHENNAQLTAGDLLLVDAGCDYAMYAADISRTYPINGKFSSAQAAIYALVLAAQKAGIAMIKPGNAWNMVQIEILTVLITGLIKLKLLSGTVAEILANKAYTKFYMHSSGHFLGLDVHDVGKYKNGDEYIKFVEGMVLTVEPGLYIATDCEVSPEFKGIGVRIEDDVLVTSEGHEILTDLVTKEINEIEAIMGNDGNDEK